MALSHPGFRLDLRLGALLEDAMTDGLRSLERVNKAMKTFQSLVLSTKSANSATYKQCARHIKLTN
jgi:hypothetical protein